MRVGSRYVHLLKMFGALFSFASAFFVLDSAYMLNQALTKASLIYPNISLGDVFGELTGPIGSLFLWLGMMVIGLALYRSDRTIFPLEEEIRDYPDAYSSSVSNAPAYPQVPRPKKKAVKKSARTKASK